jgi:hypothetical protein
MSDIPDPIPRAIQALLRADVPHPDDPPSSRELSVQRAQAYALIAIAESLQKIAEKQ